MSPGLGLSFNLFCRDPAAQMAFYAALLGLPEEAASRSPIYRALAAPGFTLGFNAAAAYALLELADRAPHGGMPPPVTAYATFLLESPAQVDAVAGQASALGGRILKAPYATYYGQWQAVLADPEGHVFRVGAAGLPSGVVAPPAPPA